MGEAAIKKYSDDEIILKQGDTEKYLYKMIAGKAAVYIDYGKPSEYLVGIISESHCFGEMTLLAGEPSSYTVVALDSAVVMRVPEDSFESFVRNNLNNAIGIMKTMAHNITLLNANINMLKDELRVLTSEENIDNEAIRRLADINTDPAIEASAAAIEENAYAENIEQNIIKNPDLFLKGHKTYPAVTHPEYENFLFKKDYTCPHCKQKFNDWRILTSKLVIDRENTYSEKYELENVFKGFDPAWYEIVSCPHCYFSAPFKYFIEPHTLNQKNFQDKLEKMHSSLYMDFTAQREQNFVFLQHYLALICARGFYDHRKITAKIWKNLCQLYKDAGDDAMTAVCLDEAVDALKAVYEHCDLNSAQEQRVCVSIAGMLYKIGRYDETYEWAYKARMIKDGKAIYSQLAYQLIQNTHEMRGRKFTEKFI